MIAVLGSVVAFGVASILIMILGFRQNAAADRVIAERISMQMAESSGLMKEMARKTDEMARRTDEMARKTDEIHEELAKLHKENSLFLRMIFERVDKNPGQA